MRGKVQQLEVSIRQAGITPAYAGKSFGRHEPRHIRKDHPRVCGEKRRPCFI